MSNRTRSKRIHFIVGCNPKEGDGITILSIEEADNAQTALQQYQGDVAAHAEVNTNGWVVHALPVAKPTLRKAVEKFLIACGVPPGPGSLPLKVREFSVGMRAMLDKIEERKGSDLGTGIPISHSKWGKK